MTVVWSEVTKGKFKSLDGVSSRDLSVLYQGYIIRTNKKYKFINLKASVQTYIGLAGLAATFCLVREHHFLF